VVAGTYRITRHIGSGGSSHVFEAEHLRLGKSFAVKVLRPELDTSRLTAQRFRREAKAVARLHSEHIVSVVDCGELDDGAPYLVMELLIGEDLRSLLNREGSLPVRRAVALIVEACRGLAVVHDASFVHRDLKPENLFVARRSTGEDWCKVLDFGVAKMEASLSTAEGAIIGTVRYMAPEQLSDAASIGPATDVYALGAILYECLSGKPVVDGTTVQEVMYRVMNAPTTPLHELVPTLPRALAETVGRCLAKTPSARPPTTPMLAELLQAAAAPRVSSLVQPDTLAEDDGLAKSRSPKRFFGRGVVAAGMVAVAAAGWATWRAMPKAPRQEVPKPQPQVARVQPPAPPHPVSEVPAPTSLPSPSAPTNARTAIARPTPRPRSSSASAPAPSAERRTPPVSQFDATNPYGE
jgi:eukaryotic-like serine/threonine-protein kinase